MPITDLSYEDMQKQAQILECECGGTLSVAWSATLNHHVLRCGNNPDHRNFVRPVRFFDRGAIPGWRYSKKERKEMEKELGTEGAAVALRHQGVAVMTREDAFELVKTYWPMAPEIEVKKAALSCARYNLDPGRRQIHLMPFQRKDKNGNAVIDPKTGKPIVDWSIAFGIGATRTMAYRQKPYVYVNGSPRPATEKEQLDLRGTIDKTHIWFITWLKDPKNKEAEPVFGFGNWPLNAQGKPYGVKGAEKGNSPENMAAIRSERAAFDKYNPDWLPAKARVYDEQYADMPKGDSKTVVVEVEGQKVVEETGEIIEENIEDGIFTDEEVTGNETESSTQAVKQEPPPVKTETKIQVGTDAWILMKMAILNISDAGILDHINKTYHIPVEPLPVSNTLVKLREEDRNHLTELILAKEKGAGKK